MSDKPRFEAVPFGGGNDMWFVYDNKTEGYCTLVIREKIARLFANAEEMAALLRGWVETFPCTEQWCEDCLERRSAQLLASLEPKGDE